MIQDFLYDIWDEYILPSLHILGTVIVCSIIGGACLGLFVVSMLFVMHLCGVK
jgi:hypothetical protein